VDFNHFVAYGDPQQTSTPHFNIWFNTWLNDWTYFSDPFFARGGAIFYRFVLRDTLYHQLL